MTPFADDRPIAQQFTDELQAAIYAFLPPFMSTVVESSAAEPDVSRAQILSGPSLCCYLGLDNDIARHRSFVACRTVEFSLHLALCRSRKSTGLDIRVFFAVAPLTSTDALDLVSDDLWAREGVRLPRHQILAARLPGTALFDLTSGALRRSTETFLRQTTRSPASRPGSSAADAFPVLTGGADLLAKLETSGDSYDPVLDEVTLNSDLGKAFLSTALVGEMQYLGRLVDDPVAGEPSPILLPPGPRTVTAPIRTRPDQVFDLKTLLLRHATLSHELAHRYLFHSTTAGCAFRALSLAHRLTRGGERPDGPPEWFAGVRRKLLRLLRAWTPLQERLGLGAYLYELNSITLERARRDPVPDASDVDLTRFGWLLDGLAPPVENSVHLLLRGAEAAARTAARTLYLEVAGVLYADRAKGHQVLLTDRYLRLILACIEASAVSILETDFLFCDEESFNQWLTTEANDFEARWKWIASRLGHPEFIRAVLETLRSAHDPAASLQPGRPREYFWSPSVKQRWRDYFTDALSRCPSRAFAEQLRRELGSLLEDTGQHLMMVPGIDGRPAFTRIGGEDPFLRVIAAELNRVAPVAQSRRETPDVRPVMPPERPFVDLLVACAYFPQDARGQASAPGARQPVLCPIREDGYSVGTILRGVLYGQTK
jgi:hypothetical protein